MTSSDPLATTWNQSRTPSYIASDDPTVTWRMAVDEADTLPTGERAPISRTESSGRRSESRMWSHVSVETDARPLSEVSPRFLTLGELGRGGMGDVLLARQTGLEREVAVKVVRPDKRTHRSAQRFRDESLIGGSLEHPAIVTVHDAGDDYMVMQRLSGSSLAEALTAHSIDLPTAITAVIRVADALAYAHSQGVLHRDIKPGNIMLGEFGEVALVDWGLALRGGQDSNHCWSPPDGLTEREVEVGTPVYLPPEVAHAQPTKLGEASDVFLLGATLFHVLTGHPPYRGEINAVLNQAAKCEPPLIDRSPTAPSRLIYLQRQMMAAEPNERPNLTDIRATLRAWLRSRADDGRADSILEEIEATRKNLATIPQDQCYAWFRKALSDLQQVAQLDPLQDIRAIQDGIHADFARTAIATNDLNLAGQITQHITDDQLRLHVAHSIDEATLAAERERKRVRRGTAITASLIGGSLLLAAGALYQVAQQEENAKQERIEEAAALLIDIEQLGDSPDALRQRQFMALRAIGLDPSSRAAAAQVSDTATQLINGAIASQNWGLAETQIQILAQNGRRWHDLATDLSQSVASARDARENARIKELQRRRDWIQSLLDTAGQPELRTESEWFREQKNEILAWDGNETGSLAATLLSTNDVNLIRLGCAIFEVRQDLAVPADLLSLLDHPESSVRSIATDALLHRQNPKHFTLLITTLQAQPDKTKAMLQAAAFVHWSDQAIRTGLDQFSDQLQAAIAAGWAHRPRWMRDRLIQLETDALPTETLKDLALICLAQVADPETAIQAATAWSEREPDTWEPHAVIALASEPNDGLEYLNTIHDEPNQSANHFPLTIHRAYALTRLERYDDAQELIRSIGGIDPDNFAFPQSDIDLLSAPSLSIVNKLGDTESTDLFYRHILRHHRAAITTARAGRRQRHILINIARHRWMRTRMLWLPANDAPIINDLRRLGDESAIAVANIAVSRLPDLSRRRELLFAKAVFASDSSEQLWWLDQAQRGTWRQVEAEDIIYHLAQQGMWGNALSWHRSWRESHPRTPAHPDIIRWMIRLGQASQIKGETAFASAQAIQSALVEMVIGDHQLYHLTPPGFTQAAWASHLADIALEERLTLGPHADEQTSSLLMTAAKLAPRNPVINASIATHRHLMAGHTEMAREAALVGIEAGLDDPRERLSGAARHLAYIVDHLANGHSANSLPLRTDRPQPALTSRSVNTHVMTNLTGHLARLDETLANKWQDWITTNATPSTHSASDETLWQSKASEPLIPWPQGDIPEVVLEHEQRAEGAQ